MDDLINGGDVAADKLETKGFSRSGSIAKSY